jgi:mannosyl-3-phosphoglycerate phosphatase
MSPAGGFPVSGAMNPPRNPADLLIVSDLDATLLHEESYGFGGVRPLLRFLADHEIPLILASSKTRKEMEEIRAELGVGGPFICENGGAIILPPGGFPGLVDGPAMDGDGEVIVLSRPIRTLQDALARLSKETGVRVRSILEMDVEEVAELTGLPLERAALAREREYALPFLAKGSKKDLEMLREKAEGRGFRVTRGGRLHHLMGDTDKARAFLRLRGLYESSGKTFFVIALGDAENDLGFLRESDQPVVIPRRAGWDPSLSDLPGARLASRPAPEGWIDEVRGLLSARGLDPP